MSALLGLSLADLVGIGYGYKALLPPPLLQLLAALSIVEVEAGSSPAAFFYDGRAQSVEELGGLFGKSLPFRLPALNAPVAFRAQWQRGNRTGLDVEPAPGDLVLDIDFDLLEVELPLTPAALVPATPGAPARLQPDPTRRVLRARTSASLRLDIPAPGANRSVEVSFGRVADPFDPDAEAGLLELAFDPPHFLVPGVGLGVTVERAQLDLSRTISDHTVRARSHGPAWQGLMLEQATVYLPPDLFAIGQVNASLENLLLGWEEGGVQGDLRASLGRPFRLAERVEFSARSGSTVTALSGVDEGADPRLVPWDGSSLVRAHVPEIPAEPEDQDQVPMVQWRVPGEKPAVGLDSGWFLPTPGAVLGVADRFVREDGTFAFGEEKRYQFVHAQPLAPAVSLSGGGLSVAGVLTVSGAPEALAGLELSVPGAVVWELPAAGILQTGPRLTLGTLPAGRHALALRDPDQPARRRRLRIEVVPGAPLLVAGLDGLSGPGVGPAVETGRYDAIAWHQRGALLPHFAPGAADDDPQEGELVARRLEVPPTHRAALHLRMFFPVDGERVEGGRALFPLEDAWDAADKLVPEAFGGSELVLDEDPRRAPSLPGAHDLPGGSAHEQLAALVERWAGALPADCCFLAVGRCSPGGSRARNLRLARDRAAVGGRMLLDAGLAAERVAWRAEMEADWQADRSGTPLAGFPDRESLDARLEVAWFAVDKIEGSEDWEQAHAEARELRRVDLYALAPRHVPGDAQPLRLEGDRGGVREVLLPGPDAAVPEARRSRPKPPFRLDLGMRWDSPVWASALDLLPTLVDVRVDWPAGPISFPDGREVAPEGGPDGVWSVRGGLSFDQHTGAMEVLLALDVEHAPGEIFSFRHREAAALLALAPAMLQGLHGHSDGKSRFVGYAALFGAATAVVWLTDDGRVRIERFEARHRRVIDASEGHYTRIGLDYAVDLHVDPAKAGVGTTEPARVRYKNVGLTYRQDSSLSLMERWGFSYDDAQFEIVDPGVWQLPGFLSGFLNIIAVRFGTGSAWVEMDLSFARDLGVIRVSGATLRVRFTEDGAELELRGLRISLDVPGVIAGEGQLELDDGKMTAALDVELIPVGVRALGHLVTDGPMTQVELAVDYASPIPLLGTGLGLFGLRGRFVSHGARALSGDDAVARELAWYDAPVDQKYEPRDGAFAFGLGAVVGSIADRGYTVNADGMLAVGGPDPSVVFGVRGKILASPRALAEVREGGVGALTGLVAFEDGVTLALRGEFDLSPLFKVSVPVGSHFGTDLRWHLRIGSDGRQGRSGDPVTVDFLPGSFGVRAWAYAMVESHGLRKLGGSDLSFDGFSFGFGAGWKSEWTAGPFALRFSARFLAGVGFKPFLVGASVAIKGELDLWLIALGVSASFSLMLGEQASSLKFHGHVCAKVSFFFFTIEGCVDIEVGSEPTREIPDPPPLIDRMLLLDRSGRVLTEAGDDAVVWPDAVAVLSFAHPLGVDLAAGHQPFDPGPGWGAAKFCGTDDLKYAYRLRSLRIKADGQSLPGPFPSTWGLPHHRPTVAEELVSEAEGWDLQLLDADPSLQLRSLPLPVAEEGQLPVADGLERLCQPGGAAQWRSALGADTVPAGPLWIAPGADLVKGGIDLDSFKVLLAEEVWDQPVAEVASMQAGSDPRWVEYGRIGTLPEEMHVEHRSFGTLTQGFVAAHARARGRILGQSLLRVRFLPALAQPLVVLATRLRKTLRLTESTMVSFEPEDAPEEFQPNQPTPSSLGVERRVTSGGVTVSDGAFRQYSNGLLLAKLVADITLPVLADDVRVQLWLENRGVARVEVGDLAWKVDLAPGSRRVAIGDGVQSFRIDVPDGTLLREVHFSVTQDVGLTEQDVAHAGLQVIGLASDRELGWELTAVHRQLFPDGDGWATFLATPPEGEKDTDWQSLRITAAPMLRAPEGSIWFLGCHGQVADEVAASQAITRLRADQREHLNQGLSGALADRIGLLPADAEIEVEATWEWVGWQREDAHDKPGEPTWGGATPVEQRFSFRTAPLASDPGVGVDLRGQDIFDPRALRRHLLGIEPAEPDVPWFFKDALQAHFGIEYVDGLLDAYGLTLVARVRRTRPAPTVVDLEDIAIEVPASLERVALPAGLRNPVTVALAEAMREAPCLSEPVDNGGSYVIQAALEPWTEYELRLQAEGPQGAYVIVRRVFRTSRYEGPLQALAALGFRLEEDVGPHAPVDLFVSGSAPREPKLGDDAALEEVLRAWGYDPLPDPDQARCFALWTEGGSGWRLAGVLLDALEPFEHPPKLGKSEPRLHAAGLTVEGEDGAKRGNLELVRSNRAGSRLLFAASEPLALTGEGVLVLEVMSGSLRLLARRAVLAGPRSFAQEAI